MGAHRRMIQTRTSVLDSIAKRARLGATSVEGGYMFAGERTALENVPSQIAQRERPMSDL